DLRGQQIQSRTETRRVSEEPAWLVSRTFYDPKGRAVVTADSFVEDAAVTAANAATFNPETGTYSSFSFDNTTATTGSFSVYDGAGRVVKTYRLKDVTIAIVTITVGSATVQKTELRVGEDTFIAPTEAAPNEQLYETYFRQLTEFFESHGAIVSSSQTEYDNAGRVTVSTDQFGRQTHTAYNLFGETIETRTESVDAAGQPVWLVSRTVYDSYGRVELSTDRYVEGNSDPVLATRTIYDEKGRAVKKLRLEGVEVGLVDGDTVVSDWGSEVWRTETVYDAKGRVWKSIGRHDASDPNSARPTTEYEYDSLGRQIAALGPAVLDERTGELVRHRAESKYDAEGRLEETWANIRVVVDAQGNVLSTDYADKQVTAFEYDAYGRTTKTVYGAGTPIESYVAQGYDDYGRVIWESDQALTSEASPLKRQFEYDDFGRLTAVVLPEVAHPTLIDGENPLLVHPRYEYAYDARGNHVSIRDNVYQTAAGIFYDHGGAAGDFSQAFDTRVTMFTYDDQGRQTSRTLPLGVATPADPDDFVERRFHSDRALAAAVAGGESLTESVALGQLE
ncbi:MAG: RHS repeat protein, partial [Pirellulaceae bacterium]|nr:RHS repeat protein [Pirellulaceae bacterium]